MSTTGPTGPACTYCRGVRIVGWGPGGPVLCPLCSRALGEAETFEMLTRAWSEQRARVLELEREVRLLRDDLREMSGRRDATPEQPFDADDHARPRKP